MTESGSSQLNAVQLAALEASLHQGSANASAALKQWLGKDSVVELDSIEQCPLEEATAILPGQGDQPICFCSMGLDGFLSGELIMGFDDSSGFALADLLLDQSSGTTESWTEMPRSIALETTNVLCCAYLNALADTFGINELLPQPPEFRRDFSASLLQFALMGQAIDFDQVIVARTRFEIEKAAVNWTLLFIPEAESMCKLANWWSGGRHQP